MKRSLRSWLWRIPLDQEVDEELSLHIELRTRELVERGLDPKQARDIVLSRIGDLGRLQRTCIDLGRKREREMRLTRFIEEFRTDVRLAIRQLIKAPGFTIVATITLALGIGVNSAIFALVDTTLMRALPFHEPERLVAVWERTDGAARGFASPLNMQDWNQRTRSFELISGFVPGMGGMVMNGSDGTAETVSRQWVMAGIFDVLGVKPLVGRMFRPDDNDQRKNMVVFSEGARGMAGTRQSSVAISASMGSPTPSLASPPRSSRCWATPRCGDCAGFHRGRSFAAHTVSRASGA
jgi:putative ABC transport system permease protein